MKKTVEEGLAYYEILSGKVSLLIGTEMKRLCSGPCKGQPDAWINVSLEVDHKELLMYSGNVANQVLQRLANAGFDLGHKQGIKKHVDQLNKRTVYEQCIGKCHICHGAGFMPHRVQLVSIAQFLDKYGDPRAAAAKSLVADSTIATYFIGSHLVGMLTFDYDGLGKVPCLAMRCECNPEKFCIACSSTGVIKVPPTANQIAHYNKNYKKQEDPIGWSAYIKNDWGEDWDKPEPEPAPEPAKEPELPKKKRLIVKGD